MRYRAFISYSHADARWARWLMRRLESYRVPARLVGTRGTYGPIGARLGAFFRDREELPSAGDLGATIRAAMAESESLVVICSPTAAKSRWVNAEVAAFRESGRGDRVLCFVIAGMPGADGPGEACFPPALLATDADGCPIEPLAADARPEGDGRERAFLKLVAGLLGVGYDTLAQRDAQRRNRTLAVVAFASLVGMSIAIGLAAAAYAARNDAQRRQAQAEDILGFMLGDLRKKLTTVGRLDLMRAVDDKAIGYFATLDARDLSDRSLEEQARSLTGIGEVRLAEGNHDAAMKAFREAHARSTALRERAPANGQRLFDLAQAEYWIGFVAWRQGRLDDAEKWLSRYRDSAIELAAMDRNKFDWQKEVAYGHQSLAVLSEARGRYAEAERAMRSQLNLYRIWVDRRPTDLELRFEATNIESWLGSLAMRQGRLAEAESFFFEEVRGLARNHAMDPLNVRWKQERVEAQVLLAEAQVQRGRLPEARASIEFATPLALELLERDAADNTRHVSLGICRWWQAQLASVQSPDDARQAADVAVALLTHAHRAEPRNDRIVGWLARARVQQAQLALIRDQREATRLYLAAARALINTAWKTGQGEDLRLWLARINLLEGELAQRSGNSAVATQSWNEARRLLLENATAPLAFGRLDPLVRALHLLGQTGEAEAHAQRLDAAGFKPLQPWPAIPTMAAR